MTTVGIIGSGMIGGTVGEAAKAAVTAFLDSIGYDAVDAGPIAESWRQEPGTPAYGTPYGPFTDEAGTPASAAKIRADLIGAHR